MGRERVLARELRARLAAAGDPERAAAQQRYMKSAMPFHGVRMPEVRRIARALFAEASFPSRDAWVEAVLALWRGARFREERYAAIELSGDRRFRAFQRPDLLPLYEELVVTGAWWDLVDPVATGRIGPLVLTYPGEAGEAMRTWARSDDLWKRRAAIICQVTARGRTDVELLTACIEPSLAERDFFLRKGIGWALREHAKTDPEWVAAYVRRTGGRLSPLSRREATRHLAGTLSV